MNRGAKLAAAIIVLSFCQSAAAQQNISRYEFGLGAGIVMYQGDLTPWRFGSYETIRLGVNLHASRILSRSLSLRANLLFGGIKGDDAKYNNPEFRKQRNFNFTSPVTELSLLMVVNPLGKNFSSKGFSPYLFAGAGLGLLHIKRDHSAFNAAYFGDGSDLIQRIALDDRHNLPRMIPVVPVGAGIRYNLSNRIAIYAESSYRFLFTDYLDGFSQAANPAFKDHYHTTTVGLIYRTGGSASNSTACPVMKY